jgi:hypothetical protein
MGRYAQCRLRGGHVGMESGLPAGPEDGQWSLVPSAPSAYAVWDVGAIAGFGFFVSRWRSPEVSMVWVPSAEDPQILDTDNQQLSPLVFVAGHPLQAEVAFADAAGNAVSQWSAYKQIT